MFHQTNGQGGFFTLFILTKLSMVYNNRKRDVLSLEKPTLFLTTSAGQGLLLV